MHLRQEVSGLKKNKNPIVRRLAQEAKPIAPYLALGVLLEVLVVLSAVAAPELMGGLVETLCDNRGGDLRSRLVPDLLRLLAVYAAYSLLDYLNIYLMNTVVSRHFTRGLRIRISDKIRRLPVRYVDQTPVGDILNRMIDDVGEVGGYIHRILGVMIRGVFQIVMITIAMVLENWILACLVLVLTPFSMWMSSKIAAISEKYYEAQFECAGKLTELVEEAFSNYPTTKAYNLEEYTAQKHETLNEQLRDMTAKANFTGSIVSPLIKLTNALAYILINLVGGWLIVRHGVSVGTVVTIVLYARQFSDPLEQIASGFSNLNHVKAAARRVYSILDYPEEERDGSIWTEPPRGNVEFDHVDFSYAEDAPLIENLNLVVKPGQKVAIVGPTGAGKTTIVNLLMRFYDPKAGSIRLDGQQIGQMQREAVRDAFGMVLQDTWLFRGTIAENIAYGKPGATQQEIEDAAKKAHCDHFIRTMPDGYQTMIGEDTTNLSGGQKQLLTIARALLANKPLLILDEATSNVDTRTEILIQKAMDTLMAGKTCFVIAHRLSTIEDADLILVLDHGHVVEQGTHQKLLAQRGFYHKLYTSQYGI